MYYYEVLVADSKYRGNDPLIYSYDQPLNRLCVVSVPLRNRLVTGFIYRRVTKPDISVKSIKSIFSEVSLPASCLKLAEWISQYYVCSLGEALRQFAPSTVTDSQRSRPELSSAYQGDLDLDSPLTKQQKEAIASINANPSTTVLLHGETGSGKTRVYLELAKRTIEAGKSVIILTPEIALTAQLEMATSQKLNAPVYVLHSQLTPASRRKLWIQILESKQPIAIIGPRSALFSPVDKLGLVVVDEAHEPAYKQELSPRYHAVRAASQLGNITSAKVVLGSATPLVSDYYLADQKNAIVRMKSLAKGPQSTEVLLVDQKNKANFKKNYVLSDQLIDAISTTLSENQQALIYHNLRGSARLILCSKCGWRMLCPNCDIPLVYHADNHLARCHSCGYRKAPPGSCPVCANPDLVFRQAGTKSLVEEVKKIFPQARIGRFDGDNLKGERLNELYEEIHDGQIDILIGTQQLAKGLDLPKLSLAAITSAETSLALPDFSSEERAFQLIYQVAGRVGRGHGDGRVVIQSFDPKNPLIRAVAVKDYQAFYKKTLQERQAYRWPPYAYLLKLVCRRLTINGAEQAAINLRQILLSQNFPVEVIGPTPSFHARKGRYYYWQLVVKSKQRQHLTALAKLTPSGWMIDLDPTNLL